MVKSMLKSKSNTSKQRELAERVDSAAIKYDTKGMSDKQKKIYTLNYYNDRKAVSRRQAQDANDSLNKVRNTSKSRSEQRTIDLMGSDWLTEVSNIQLKNAETMYGHYSQKVNNALNDIGDIKLSTVKSRRSVTSGNTVYSWYGDEYVEKK